MTIASWVDDAIMLIILLLAFDGLRKVSFFAQPLQTVSFVLLSVGSFGKIAWNFGGADTHWWAIAMHAGFAIYAIRVFGTGTLHWRRQRKPQQARES